MPSGMEQGINELNDTTVFFKLYAPFKNRVWNTAEIFMCVVNEGTLK